MKHQIFNQLPINTSRPLQMKPRFIHELLLEIPLVSICEMFCTISLHISVQQLQLFQDSIYTEEILCFLYKSYCSHQQLQRQKMTQAGTDW